MSAASHPGSPPEADADPPTLALAEAAVRIGRVRTSRAPHLRSRLDDRRVMGAFVLALVPISAWVIYQGGAALALPRFATAFAVGALWEHLFAALRGRAPDHRALGAMALLFALGSPAAVPSWQLAIGVSFGIVLGKEIFGGFGRNVAHPVVVGLVFLHLAWPQPTAGAAALGHTSVWACAIGAVLLVATGTGSARVVVGGLAGLAAAAAIAYAASEASATELAAHAPAALGAAAFALVFLATDPVTAPLTNPARWLYGAAIGALWIAIRVANPVQREAAVLAVLMGNLMAPLLDEAVLRLHAARRALRRA